MIMEIIIWIAAFGAAFLAGVIAAGTRWRDGLHTSIWIDAPPERVWDELTGFDAYQEWNPFIRELSGEVREGARLTASIQPLDQDAPMRFRPRVIRAEPGRALEWRGALGPGLFTGKHCFRIEPEHGGSRLIHGERFTGLLVPFIPAGRFIPSFEAMNRALKLRAER
jgi:hypothetical protein